jgi:hypothetical protein
MKSWLGVIGRACLEFLIILSLIAFAAGASSSLAASSGGPRILSIYAAKAALDLIPLAVVITLFLAFFSFELRVKSRLAGWLGLILLGSIILSSGLELRRLPLVREALVSSSAAISEKPRLLPAAKAVQAGRVALWIGSYQGGEANEVVAVDFSSDYPRLAYSSSAALDASGGFEIQGKAYSSRLPGGKGIVLVPEAGVFEGNWIWDRLSAMDDQPLYAVLAAAGGFLLFGVGFRFLCRISGWPLANVFIAAAGLGGLVVLDALLSSPAILGQLASLSRRSGIVLPETLLLACFEGALGLLLGAVDLARAPKTGRALDE